MKVRDLIAELQKHDADLLVFRDNDWGHHEPPTVTIEFVVVDDDEIASPGSEGGDGAIKVVMI
jgi:hypothetical protein